MTDQLTAPDPKCSATLHLYFPADIAPEVKALAYRRSIEIMHEEQAESHRRIIQRMLAEFPTVEMRQEQA